MPPFLPAAGGSASGVRAGGQRRPEPGGRAAPDKKLLMNLFLSKRNQVITYETIENYVWEGNFVTLESIRSLIRRLRKILDKEFIQTVTDTGYIFKNI